MSDEKLQEEAVEQSAKLAGQRIDRLFRLYDEKAEAEKAVKEIDENIKALESTLYATLTKQELSSLSSPSGTVYLKEELYPKIEDWDALVTFAVREGFAGMIQKRIASTTFKEYYLDRGEYPPGTSATTGTKLARRKA